MWLYSYLLPICHLFSILESEFMIARNDDLVLVGKLAWNYFFMIFVLFQLIPWSQFLPPPIVHFDLCASLSTLVNGARIWFRIAVWLSWFAMLARFLWLGRVSRESFPGFDTISMYFLLRPRSDNETEPGNVPSGSGSKKETVLWLMFPFIVSSS